jgi:hypothetical protein
MNKPTVKQIKDFLLSDEVFDGLEGMSTINPGLTKKQVWDIAMGSVFGKSDDETIHSLAIKNIEREFGRIA